MGRADSNYKRKVFLENMEMIRTGSHVIYKGQIYTVLVEVDALLKWIHRDGERAVLADASEMELISEVMH